MIQTRAKTTPFHYYLNHLHSQARSFFTKRIRTPIPFVTEIKEFQDPDHALSLFDKYNQMGINHSYPSYSALIYKLARSRRFDDVDTILDRIRDGNIFCKESLFIALIQHYGKAGLVEKSINLFQRMRRGFNCVRTLQSLNTILNVLVDNDRLFDANELFSKAYKMGFKPNSITFNIMIKGWLGRNDWEQACKVFEEMLEKEIQPSVVTYNCLIGFLCKKCDMGKAMELFEDMRKKGKKSNAVTYASLMAGLCSLGKYKEAKKMMFDMEYRGCKPGVVNFGVLMSDLGRNGKIEEAKALLVEMRQKRLKPDVVIYNILINYMCKEGQVSEAYKTLIEMQMKGCEPNAATFRMMVDGFCGARDFDGGVRVFNAMLLTKHCPREETFCCLILGLLELRKIDDACYVMEEMEKRKMRFGLENWESLIKDYCNKDGVIKSMLNELTSS